MTELKESNQYEDNESEMYSNKIKPINSNLNLQEETSKIKQISKSNIDNENNNLNIKQRLSLQLLNLMLQAPNTSKEEKDMINQLIKEIKENNYYYCFSDLNGANPILLTSIKQNKEKIEKLELLEFPKTINYDIEFYKIGKKCNALKKRYAIIKNGNLYSSKVPINQLNKKDMEKLKEKTVYLEGAEILQQTLSNHNKNEGEWSNRSKKYRIRVNYLENKMTKKTSSFFFYFNEKKEMNEVILSLFNLCKKDKYKKNAKEVINRLCKTLISGNKLYAILKILSWKKINKKRKSELSQIAYSKKVNASANIDKNFLEKKIIEKKDIPIYVNSINNNSILPNLYAKNKKNEIINSQNHVNNNISISNFMPLISSASSNNNNLLNRNSLNDLIQKYNSLKNKIPISILNNNMNFLSENGISFMISNGIEIKNYSGNNNSFNMMPEIGKNIKYIFIDKNNPEIKFKIDNNDNDFNQNVLSGDNIYEISNIIKNAGNNMHDEEENNLIILGPKIDNNKGITYKYKNNDNSYSDPESINIKDKTINSINNNSEKVITLQIILSELNINNIKINSIFQNVLISDSINLYNINNNILFGYKIKLNQLKSIEGQMAKIKSIEENICLIEYNTQYYIPEEYFNKNNEIIVETYCIPLKSFNNKESIIPNNKLGCMSNYLSAVKIGYTKINLNDLKKGKNKFEIMNDGIILDKSYIIITGMIEKIERMNMTNNIEGKDYSIGNDSYIITKINKDFIEKAKNNQNISDEIKDKYFNVCFDAKDNDNILLRPNENMDENSFIRDISTQISNEDLQRIFINKKYKYLPYCEKFFDLESLNKSDNLSGLSENQKKYIIKNYKYGEWIYKIPEIKVKLLSKNLGIIKNNNNLSQRIYCLNEEKIYPLDNLINNNEERIIPLSENNFNAFDFKELHQINLDNFQWKIGIKFNNTLQMESFIKLLNIARQNINTKKRNEKEYIVFQERKTINLNEFKSEYKPSIHSYNQEENFVNKCEILIEYIDFIQDFKLKNNPSILESKLSIIGNNQEDMKEIYFQQKYEIDKNKFNNGSKFINLNQNLIFNLNNELENFIDNLVINFGGFELFTPFNIKQILNISKCNILELPLYKKDEKTDFAEIIGYIEIKILVIEQKSSTNFNNIYEEINMKYLKEPLLLIKEDTNYNKKSDYRSKNSHFGLYEPNVYRRKILNLIHNKKSINIDPSNLKKAKQDDLKRLYQLLSNECVILPDLSNFEYFQFADLRRNNDIYDVNNSYRKKLGLELLRVKRHNEFMKLFRQNRWDLFLNKFNKGQKLNNPIYYLSTISDKNILIKNKEFANYLQNLMYLGVPSAEYRKDIYSALLERTKLSEKTKSIIFEKYNEKVESPQEIFKFFADQLFVDNPKINIIFSLIDNDSNYISSLENSSLEEINAIKKIAKSFFIWAELRIGLEDKNDKYVYFIGLLSLIQKLLRYFEEDWITFWILVGLSRNIAHFHQKNPLFSNEINYINTYGLVTKLIMERHLKKIYDKFISLNIPPELFISRHLSTLFTDYFEDELMMRILDIIIFESSFKDYYNDNLQYLRILCSIPLTLFEFNQDRILACKSVSEIHSIMNDLNLCTFNHNLFISKLAENINKYYIVSSFFETWFFNNKGREWDSKRGEIENLIRSHFYPVYYENKTFLYEIATKLKLNSQKIIELYFNNIDNELNSIKSLYQMGTSDYDDSKSTIGIGIQISKLKQIFNNENCFIIEYILVISFGNVSDNEDKKLGNCQLKLNFDSQNNEIINAQELFYKNQFLIRQFPKYIHFLLYDKNFNIKATFSYKILNYEQLKISKIILENKQETNKFYLEFVLFKYTSKYIYSDELLLYNSIFSPPEYSHSKKIEEKLYSYEVSNSSFNQYITQLIKIQNNNRNTILNGAGFDQCKVDIFKQMNNNAEKEDNYNYERFINRKNNNNFNEKISKKIMKIIDNIIQKEISTIIKEWFGNSNISFEEIFYSIILVDKSLVSINEKLYSLFSIAQLRDKLLFNIDDISVEKLKEMIYSLYKRFRIYFTKTDVERMIDFLLKDEKLVNIKYVFVHNKDNISKINEIIYNKDYYEPKIDNDRKQFEIIFDDISKELIIYLNHLNNHYNLNTFSSELISHIFREIIGKKDLKKYKENNLDTITLVIEKDDIIYKRYYTIGYTPLNIKEHILYSYYVKPKNNQDFLNCELCYEISNININHSYNTKKYLNFATFKKIFFKLPYLSDLFRVSFSYLCQDNNSPKKEFESFKVTVGYEGYSQSIFYFPYNREEDDFENNYDQLTKYNMDYKIKISDTVDQIINGIIKKINNNKFRINNEEALIIDYLTSIYKIECYILYEIDEEKTGRLLKEKIGYFDNLYSCIALKERKSAEIQIMLNNDIMTLNSSRQYELREDGYCKIYESNNNDFSWKKCKIKRKNKENCKLASSEYKTIPRILNKNDDVIYAYDI